MIAGGFLPLPNGFLTASQRNGFLPPSTLGAAVSTTDLTVSIADNGDLWNVETLTYTISSTNAGAVEAENVEVVVTLDSALTYVSGIGTGWTVNESAGVVTCTRAALAAGAAPDITITVTTPDAADTLTTSVTADADNATAQVNDSEDTTVTLVTRDTTSGKRVPASSAEWTAVMSRAGLATGNPSSQWLCQEASGNLADSIGAISLTAAGTPNYQQAIAGWTRKGVTFDDATSDAFSSTSGSLPTLLTESQLVIAYVKMPAAAPAATRNIILLGGAGTRFTATINTTPRLIATHTPNTSTGAVNACDDAVHPIVLRHRATAEADLFTDAEKLSPAFSVTVAGRGLLIGSASAIAAVGLLYLVSFHLAAADLTDAQVKTLLQTLGWTVGW